ncbi:hypothetical protein CRG98_012853 [Punica granatum]|uniref:Uncharacterized protein n=1 Tax=Punica granatum TaxID=22663 RepID=A0A2I0KEA8_PUNGR|nr:hypothetical protein CRG98_012853 [Punica granatum]
MARLMASQQGRPEQEKRQGDRLLVKRELDIHQQPSKKEASSISETLAVAHPSLIPLATPTRSPQQGQLLLNNALFASTYVVPPTNRHVKSMCAILDHQT